MNTTPTIATAHASPNALSKGIARKAAATRERLYATSYTANTRPRYPSGIASCTIVSTGIFFHANVSPTAKLAIRTLQPVM